eukprot:5713393-Pyramimonas_sp.AAC.1
MSPHSFFTREPQGGTQVGLGHCDFMFTMDMWSESYVIYIPERGTDNYFPYLGFAQKGSYPVGLKGRAVLPAPG